MKASVVIGACFGDEGKGLVVDHLCAPHGTRAIVVRFNGGANAGHTVVQPGGRRYVFHHFGSGTFAGAATFLSRFFIVNPLLWQKEITELGFMPHCVVDPQAMLTTPYDMLLNQEIENYRDGERHGSCGIGINETVERCESNLYSTHVRDILYLNTLKDRLIAIREEYVIPRLRQVAGASERFRKLLTSDSLLYSFLGACAQFSENCTLLGEEYLRVTPRQIVFEGAQGLLLDQSHPFFPNVTRSNTGLQNALAIAAPLGLDLDVYYVTRTYMTRHGVGPFPSEDVRLSYPDNTNITNEWQGGLRFGTLDPELVAAAIREDLNRVADPSMIATASLAVTHADQCVILQAEKLSTICNLPIALASVGATREHVRIYKRVAA